MNFLKTLTRKIKKHFWQQEKVFRSYQGRHIKITIEAYGADIVIVGQKKNAVDITICDHKGEIYYGFAGRELVIRVTSENGKFPTLRVYLPINLGVEKLVVNTAPGDIVVNSVVTKAFIERADLSACCGDILLNGNNIIKEHNIYCISDCYCSVDYQQIQSDLMVRVSNNKDAYLLDNYRAYNKKVNFSTTTFKTEEGFDVRIDHD